MIDDVHSHGRRPPHFRRALSDIASQTFFTMRSHLLFLIFISSLYLANTINSSRRDHVAVAVEESFVVAGYLPDYRAYINVNSTALYLTDMMLFSLTPETIIQRYSVDTALSSSNPSGGCCLSSEHFDLARKARSYKQEHQLTKKIRMLVTIGGGGRSNGFHELLTGSAKLQHHFLNALVALW